MAEEPKTLQEAVKYFADPINCREYLVARRWPHGVVCPRCGTRNVLYLEKYARWHCREKHPAPQFTLKTGTVCEDSPIGLDKWLLATWMVVNCKNGVSSYEIHRALGVTQKTAWFMDHRIRLALQDPATGGKLGGAFRYVDEQAYRYNNRKLTDAERFSLAVAGGRRRQARHVEPTDGETGRRSIGR